MFFNFHSKKRIVLFCFLLFYFCCFFVCVSLENVFQAFLIGAVSGWGGILKVLCIILHLIKVICL